MGTPEMPSTGSPSSPSEHSDIDLRTSPRAALERIESELDGNHLARLRTYAAILGEGAWLAHYQAFAKPELGDETLFGTPLDGLYAELLRQTVQAGKLLIDEENFTPPDPVFERLFSEMYPLFQAERNRRNAERLRVRNAITFQPVVFVQELEEAYLLKRAFQTSPRDKTEDPPRPAILRIDRIARYCDQKIFLASINPYIENDEMPPDDFLPHELLLRKTEPFRWIHGKNTLGDRLRSGKVSALLTVPRAILWLASVHYAHNTELQETMTSEHYFSKISQELFPKFYTTDPGDSESTTELTVGYSKSAE